MEALSPKIQGAITNFYKFWTDQWQTNSSTYDTADLTKDMVSQNIRSLGLAMECQETLTGIQTRKKFSIDRLPSIEEELNKIKAEVEEMKTQRVEDATKLESALAQIKTLKKEVHESQYKVASLT